MSSFGITTARALFSKLLEEQDDFRRSHWQSERHALNAIMTAYHLYEWVWGEFAKKRPDLHPTWGLGVAKKPRDGFLAYLVQRCPALAEAQNLTNGTKHFALTKASTGKHQGAFDPRAFQASAFDVSYLWIERDGRKQPADEFLQELVNFWAAFIAENNL